jgi:G:T-mismatch repair DNA endonuclease (very short patch repair protein)
VRRCVECGTTLRGQGRRLYCSLKCSLVERECSSCGDTFTFERKRKDRTVCSLACRPTREWGNPKISVECRHCGEIMDRYPSQLAAGRGKYCSRSCAAVDRPIRGRSKIGDASIRLFLKMSGATGVVAEYRIGPWSIDMALPDHRIAVELDGVYWHGLPEMVDRDRRKDADLAARGWTVVRIPILKNDAPDDVASRIVEALEPCKQTT